MIFKTKKEREQFIKDNIYMVDHVAKSYSNKTGIDIQELESYGYEGLIVGIDKFDDSKGTDLTSYLYTYIRGYILRGIESMNLLCNINSYFSFMKIKKEVEENNCTTLEEDLSISTEIADLMVERGYISLDQRGNFFRRILFNMPDSIAQHKQDLAYSDETVFYSAVYALCRGKLRDCVDILPKTMKEIITNYFGLDGKECKTLKSIAEEYNYPIGRIKELKRRALERLKQLYSLDLYEFIEVFNECNQDNAIVKTKSRNFR